MNKAPTFHTIREWSSLLFGTEVILFSPIEGRVTYKGEPAANAVIRRVIKWKNNIGQAETFHTDANGVFELPLKRTKARLYPLAEFVISQSLFVEYEGQRFQIWGRTKRGTKLYDELGGRPVNFRCELTDDVDYIDVEDGLFGTSCVWDTVE